MNLPNHDNCLFSSCLKINYDRRFIHSAQDMVTNLARLCGADKEEIYHLTMLIEECLVFIMDKYIDDKMKAHIDIGYRFLNNGTVLLELSDLGRPIQKETIPEFNLQDADTVNGLWYKMVRQLADGFEFINQLNRGWIIRIEKNIRKPAFEHDLTSETTALPMNQPVSGKLSAREARPEDAPALVDLAFMTYRYSYGLQEFYDAERLKTHIEEKGSDITVVEIAGRIIGAHSMKYSVSDPKSSEMSSAMVHPDYRKTRAAFLLLLDAIKYHEHNPRQVDFFVSHIVTTHVRSQKAVEKIHRAYKPLSISLNMVPSPDFIGIEKKAAMRESLLGSYHLNGVLQTPKIHAPAQHAEIIGELLENTGNPIEISTESTKPAGQTDITSLAIDTLQSATVTIKTLGEKWFSKLCRTMLALTSSGNRTIIVSLSACAPLPDDLDEKLAGLNLVFCGLSMGSLKEVRLAYIYTSDPVDFSLIELHSPVAKKLLGHIKKHYAHIREQNTI